MKPTAESRSEGDVETQFVLPLLMRSDFLSIPVEDIRSKEGISARDIGKGSKKKIGYIPDFCVYKQSLPILIVEAKSPANDTAKAYAEARLYAGEINRSFPPDVNPCCRVLATNGDEILAGHWDSEPTIQARRSDLMVGSQLLDELAQLLGDDALQHLATPISTKLKASNFKRPFNYGAGPAQIQSKIEPNTFAADLSPILRKYFSSRDQTSDPEIYSRAYISSDEITSYDRILESYLKDRLSRSKARVEITTSRRRAHQLTEPISKFAENHPVGGDIQLVTGGVGAGKSLFARRYYEYLQPAALAKSSYWAFLNFNNADFSRLNEWVCENFVSSLLEEGAPVDVRDGEDQERIFAPDLADRKAYYDRMEQAQAGRGGLERARDIEGWRQEPLKLARGISRYVQGDKSENIVAVFDNVDRRESEAQLAAFETALWFMDQTRCLIILQMRDSTFEAYKNQPPLDTYRTGKIFHISSPRFIDVVKRRLELSLEAIDREAPEQVRYRTNSGLLISYPKERAGVFLRGIYGELFQKPSNLSRVLEALAGRNVRRALDIFLAILTSGHMPDDVISSVANGTGFRSIPEHIALRALMRQDFRFFNNDCEFVANLFHCETYWNRPTNVMIVEILFYLIGRRKFKGDNGQLGYVAMIRMSLDLETVGFVKSDIADACNFALSKGLIEVETSSTDEIRERDCIKATASGWAHMRLLSSRIEYLASILTVTPINDEKFAARVYDMMQLEDRSGHLFYSQTVGLVTMLQTYIKGQHDALMMHPGYADRKQTGTKYILSKIEEALQFARRESAQVSPQLDLLDG